MTSAGEHTSNLTLNAPRKAELFDIEGFGKIMVTMATHYLTVTKLCLAH